MNEGDQVTILRNGRPLARAEILSIESDDCIGNPETFVRIKVLSSADVRLTIGQVRSLRYHGHGALDHMTGLEWLRNKGRNKIGTVKFRAALTGAPRP